MTPDSIQRFTSSCRHCGHKFKHISFAVPSLGQEQGKPDPRVFELVKVFAAHLDRKHSDEYPGAGIAAQQLAHGTTGFWQEQKLMFGLAVLVRFEHEDPILRMIVDATRLVLHRMTRRATLDDATLLDRVARLELSNGDQSKVVELCKSLRDFLMETPQVPQNQVVETPQ
jgi:hypothetical protein